MKVRTRKCFNVFAVMAVLTLSVLLILSALRQNIQWYRTPSEVSKHPPKAFHVMHLGGLVEKGSVHFTQEGKAVTFVLTDYHHRIHVHYHGVLPALFHEGKGAVIQGSFDQRHQFKAQLVLAKHNATYQPPSGKTT